jgi:hypothetical protein
MAKRTVLCVTNISSRNSVAAFLQHAGYDVVAVRPRQAAAMLAVNRRINAVVVEQNDEVSSEPPLTTRLRSIRSDIPILRVPPAIEDRETCLESRFRTADIDTIPRDLETLMAGVAA